MAQGIGDRFQQETKYHLGSTGGLVIDPATRPELYKTYPGSRKIGLPAHDARGSAPLDQVLRKRKSIRDFIRDPLTTEQLSFLLWASTGIHRREMGYSFRTAPSAGALYPIETYVAVNNIEGLDAGVYHYSIKDHSLEELQTGSFGDKLAAAALGQRMCAEAAAVFVWTAIFRRTNWKYGQRGYRYIYLDAGHIAENLALASTALELGSCEIGALFDDEVNKIIGVGGIEESVVCMCAVGRI